jgi:hypothetical protein
VSCSEIISRIPQLAVQANARAMFRTEIDIAVLELIPSFINNTLDLHSLKRCYYQPTTSTTTNTFITPSTSTPPPLLSRRSFIKNGPKPSNDKEERGRIDRKCSSWIHGWRSILEGSCLCCRWSVSMPRPRSLRESLLRCLIHLLHPFIFPIPNSHHPSWVNTK